MIAGCCNHAVCCMYQEVLEDAGTQVLVASYAMLLTRQVVTMRMTDARGFLVLWGCTGM
jgi:hypothetical protein